MDEERTETEIPFIEQLYSLDWDWLEGDRNDPSASERDNFNQVLLEDRLKNALRRINLNDDGEEWLDDTRIRQAVGELRSLPGPSVIRANQKAFQLLQEGTAVDAWPEKTGFEGEPTVNYIDFENPERNDFLAINQFRVDPAGGQRSKFPDIVLFVNGIPLVVVECKASTAGADPIDEALTQLFGYEDRRDDKRGIPKLFHYNQVLVATCFEDAVAGPVGAPEQQFLQWRDVWPSDKDDLKEKLGREHLTPQHTLVEGMLRPKNLLDLLRNFTLFDHGGDQTTKLVGRYQQFRSVHRAIDRMKSGSPRTNGDRNDRRGGIIWHTQGSGKSLTMSFLVRKMRRDPELRSYKVVVVTDRTALEDQLRKTAKLTGQPVKTARDTDHLKELLRQPGEGLVFAMIQKYQEREEGEKFPELNDDEDILVLVDEAHRSQTQKLHANLLRALPNCARIGFTGTPVLMGNKKRTHEIFGPYIDKYTIEESVDDGATLPVYYEGRATEWNAVDRESLDRHFDLAFEHLPEDKRDDIYQRYVTKQTVGASEDVIRGKARDMLWHYIDKILPNGTKAQVVGADREAAVRYQSALEGAKAEILSEAEQAGGHLRGLTEREREELPEQTRRLAGAVKHQDVIERLEFAACISGIQHDPDDWSRWSTKGRTRAYRNRFKKPLVHENPEKQDGLAFLCVNSMLLTGFDAEVEQVMYLDRSLRQHNLLQAIARTNRRYPGKEYGLVVDYWNVADELKKALDVYSKADVQGALMDIEEELPRLKDRRDRVVGMFEAEGLDIHDEDDLEDCIEFLEDVRTRAEFLNHYKNFLSSLDIVMPRSEALDYQKDAERLGLINDKAGKRYRDDEQRHLRGASEKVRELLDDYVESEGIEPRIEPVSIMDADFEDEVESEPTPKAKASEMEHAMRHHIDVHYDEDPVRYEDVSERLEEIRERCEGEWEQMYEKLRELKDRELTGEPDDPDETGLGDDELPFYRILKRESLEIAKAEVDELVDTEFDEAYLDALIETTEGIVEIIRREIDRVDFWESAQYQDQLRNKLTRHLIKNSDFDPPTCETVADDLVQLARENTGKL